MASSSGSVAIGSTSGAKAQNAEWFAADLTADIESDVARTFRVTVSALGDILQVTLDSGTTWVTLATLTANTLTTFNIPVRSTDTFNLRVTDVGGTTVDFCRVDMLSE